MSKRILKTIFIILSSISIYWTIELIPDRTNRNLTAFNQQYPFENELEISEKFTTDFKSSYEISFNLEDPRPYENIDSLRPIEFNIKIFRNNKPIEVFENNSFLSKRGEEYELQLKFVNANSKPNILNVSIQTNVPGPTYELLIEREFEWIFWIINGIIMLIALICGYFGFRKKPADNNV
ncbi:conserved protein of unknown function [Tenacibaculum sp. 190130A14a]|uniref:Uncharacterized protein n=1 Tax=Tenacibaculum polynesiense TaxID=3137857 RepID=A0ABP1ESY7_9FLAO